jgi:hypothetical protein
MMNPVISRLSQIGAKGGALAMLAAFAAFAVSRDPIALLVFPILISAVQLLCLIEGRTGAMMQRLPVRVAGSALARLSAEVDGSAQKCDQRSYPPARIRPGPC